MVLVVIHGRKSNLSTSQPFSVFSIDTALCSLQAVDLCHIASGIKSRITQSIRKWHGKTSNDKQEARETSQTTRERGPSREGAVYEEVTLKNFLGIISCMTISMIYSIAVLHLWPLLHQISPFRKVYGFSFRGCIHSSRDSLPSSWVSPIARSIWPIKMFHDAS